MSSTADSEPPRLPSTDVESENNNEIPLEQPKIKDDFGDFDDFPASNENFGQSEKNDQNDFFGDFDTTQESSAQPGNNATDAFNSFDAFSAGPEKIENDSTSKQDKNTEFTFDDFPTTNNTEQTTPTNIGFGASNDPFEADFNAFETNTEQNDSFFENSNQAFEANFNEQTTSALQNQPKSVEPLKSLSEIQNSLLDIYSLDKSSSSSHQNSTEPTQNSKSSKENKTTLNNCSKNKSSFYPLQTYLHSTTTDKNDPDGLEDRLKIDRKKENYAESLYSAVNSTSNEPVFRYRWEKIKVKKKHDKIREELLMLQ